MREKIRVPPLKNFRLNKAHWEKGHDSNFNETVKNLDQILNHYQKTFPKGFQQLFATLPKEEIWRFFVDGKHQIAGQHWCQYHGRQPRYFIGMCRGMTHMLTAVAQHEPLSAALILHLHKLSMNGILGSLYDKATFLTIDYAKFDSVYNGGFGFSTNISLKGLKETLTHFGSNPFLRLRFGGAKEEISKESMKENKEDLNELAERFYAQSIARDTKEKGGLLYNAFLHLPKREAERTLDDMVSQIIASYEKDIAVAKNSIEKLAVIAHHIRALEQLHPFYDGNCRTLCMLLLNFLLLRNGFPPVILFDPNNFDGHSTDELIQQMVEGMQNVFEILDKKKLYNLSTPEIIAAYKTDSIKRKLEILENALKEYHVPALAPAMEEEKECKSVAKIMTRLQISLTNKKDSGKEEKKAEMKETKEIKREAVAMEVCEAQPRRGMKRKR